MEPNVNTNTERRGGEAGYTPVPTRAAAKAGGGLLTALRSARFTRLLRPPAAGRPRATGNHLSPPAAESAFRFNCQIQSPAAGEKK